MQVINEEILNWSSCKV